MRFSILKIGLDPILHFESVGRLRSLKLAADELGLSQPAITHSLKKLESNLNVKLCIRSRAGFALTEPGKRLYKLSQAIKKDLRDYESFLENQENFDGIFSVGVLDNIQNKKLELAIKELTNALPNVKLNIQSYTADEIQEFISIGELDVGIGVFNHKQNHLSYFEVGAEKICHYISENHELWKKTKIGKRDIQDYPFTWVDMISRNRNALETEIFAKNHTAKKYFGSYANNLNAAVFILQTGSSIVPLPEGHLESKKLAFKYRKLTQAFKPYSLKQEVAFRADFASSSQATTYFLDTLRKL